MSKRDGIDRLPIRLEPEFYRALKKKALDDHTTLQIVGKSLFSKWLRGEVTASTKPPVIGSGLSKALLSLEEIRDILISVLHEKQPSGKSVEFPATADDLPGKTGEVLSAPTEHPRPALDLGTGTGQPASWRKGYRKKRPGQGG